jgi:hypothetical protein
MLDFNRNERFEDVVQYITDNYKEAPLETLKEVIDYVCERYVMWHGKIPDSYQLSLLANLILRDDISNPSPNKVQKEAYPFHSDAQRKRRNRKEFVAMDDTLEHMNFKRKKNLSTAQPKEDLKV